MAHSFAPHRAAAPKPRRRFSLLKWVLGAGVVYALGFLIFAATLPSNPSVPPKADGIVALTGGDARIDAADSLFESGVGKRLLISGVNPGTTKNDLEHLTHAGKRFDCCTDLGFAAVDTRGNALEAADWVRTHHYRSIVLVTSNYHMPRSLNEFSAAMPGVRVTPYPVAPDGVDLAQWWNDPKALRLLQGEYAKYLASLVATTLGSANHTRDSDTHPERRASSDRS